MDDESKALVPIEQRDVVFYDDTITAVLVEVDAQRVVYVPLRPICDFLGVSWSGQLERINRDPVLSDVVRFVRVTRTNTGGNPNVMAMPLDYLNGWMFGINANRVKEEVRERLIRYQRECYRVLSEAFTDGRLTTDSAFEELLTQTDNPAVQAYHIARAIMRLSQNQIVMEARLTGRIDAHEERLEAIEAQLAPPAHAVSQGQAMQVSQAVKAVAIALGKQTGKNEFGGVYGELYRKFEITSYKLLPAAKFEAAMSWLTEWHQSLTGDAPF